MRRPSALSRNHYFVIGLMLGLVLSCCIPQDIWELLVQQEECPQEAAENLLIERFGQDFEPHLNLINKPLAAKKPVKNLTRPRYYSSELGIREKIFIGVMTSQENINSYATAFNRTTAHLVNKIKFFINADSVKTNYQLKNIVGFTDTRESRRPFYVIKYIADNYLDDYDYFLLVPDNVYVDARKLNTLLYHMSITFDLYMGSISNAKSDAVEDAPEDADAVNSDANGNANGQTDRNYCALEAGILLSSSVIRKMRNNLDRCVRIGITNDHSVNIGRCVKYASRVAGCQDTFQGMRQYSYALNTKARQYKDLSILAKEEAFRNATTVYPVHTPEDFYRLHAYYSKHHLELVQQRGYALEQKSYRIANGSISNKILEIRWPLGVPPPSAPETRHDMLTWQLLNGTHSFLPANAQADHAVAPLSRIEALDFAKVLEIGLQYAQQKYPKLQYHSLHSAYRKFDATRGMDYQLHLNLYEASTPKRLLLKSFEVVKPLGRVEVVPSPYVTESTRIAILVPSFEHQVPDALDFVSQYERICMHNQDNTFLLLIFLYRLDSPSKGDDDDPFKSLKKLALDLSSKYKTDGSRIAWVSIRLPEQLSAPVKPEDWLLHASMYGPRQLLSLAVADLALPKLGLDSLVLVATPSMLFRTDFLNRVRMNTIQGFQVYAPIGFQLYPCTWAEFCKECDTCDISQSSGYFDRHNHDVIAFYSRDYVQARKLLDPLGLPIMRTDLDIEQLLLQQTSQHPTSGIHSILDMFVAAQHSVHILRAVEPHLRFGLDVRNHLARGGSMPSTLPQSCGRMQCIHLASRKQIGDAIIRYEDKTILQK